MNNSYKKTFKKDEILFHIGALEDFAYIIEEGSVEVLINKNNELIRIATRTVGSIVGEIAMIDNKSRAVTIRALEDCNVIKVTQREFMRRMSSADPIIKMVLQIITTKYRDIFSKHDFEKDGKIIVETIEEIDSKKSMHNIAISRIKEANELSTAIKKEELCLYYQPIIDIRNMRIAGFEALMRWPHPEKGMIPPVVFIPIAEQNNMINELSDMALRISCDAIKEIQENSNNSIDLFIAVNFSVKDFSNGDFFNNVKLTLEDKNILPSQIHLEITEGLLMEAPDITKKALVKCNDYGLKISIDDFGTGYSSLSYLHQFPITTLKIDRSFVSSMLKDDSSMILVKTIAGLAHSLGMDIIAEGIETPEEARILREIGCENCQGYWFARPMPLNQAIKFIKKWKYPEF